MAKIVTAIFSFILFIALFFGYGTVTVCLKEKSQGEFKDKQLFTAFGCSGVSFTLTKSELEKVVLLYDFQIVDNFYFNDIETFYFYSNKVLKKEIINGKRVNLHAVKNGESYTVGVPFIYYGY